MFFYITGRAVIQTKPLRIITQDFDLIAEVDGYSSLHFTRRFHGIDELELTVNRHIRGASELLLGRIIIVGSDLHKAFKIRSREIALDESGKQSENWKIHARGLKSDLNLRLALPPTGFAQDSVNTNAESVMKHYVTSNMIDTEAERRDSYLTVAPNLNRGAVVQWQSRFKPLDGEVTEISELTGLGWNIALDLENRKRIFDVIEGRNLTTAQSEYPPVIFAPQFDSLKTMEYAHSDLNYRSVAYVAGAGEGEDRRIVVVGDSTGMNRYELFVDARDIAETETVDGEEIPIPESDIIAALTERGLQKLAEYSNEQYLTAQVLTNSPFVYERDYDLGDIVTVKNDDWGFGMDARITEVTEIYEAGKPFQIEATFGIAKPTFTSVIKKEFSDMRTELYR